MGDLARLLKAPFYIAAAVAMILGATIILAVIEPRHD